jgi:Flp pilus assembly protein TadD
LDLFKAIKLNPSESKYYVAQGDAYLLVGNPRSCRSALEQAISVNNKDTEAYLKLAELSLYFKDYEQVFMQLEKATEIEPGNAKAYFIRAFALKEKGDTASAVKSFQKAIDLKQDYFDAYIQLGMLYTVKKSKLALDYLNNAASLRPESIEPMYFKGLYYQETDQLNEAMAEYNKILKVEPGNKFAQFNLGYIHMYYLKVFGEAAKYFSRAVEIDPSYVEAWYNRGYSYELGGDVTRARSDYNKALELKPGYPLPMAGLKRLEAADKGLPLQPK